MAKKLKVMILSETYPLRGYFDGAAVFTERLAKGLAENGNKVLAIGPNSDFKDRVSSEGPNLKVFRLKSFLIKPVHPFFRFIYSMNLYGKVKKAAEEFNPDIIHIQNHFLLGRIALRISKKMKVPVGGTNHFMLENLIQWMPLGKRETSKIMWLDFRRVYEKLDFITAPTNAAAELLKKIGLNGKVIVISNGIDLKRFKRIVVEKGFLRDQGFDNNLPTFLFVGRVDYDKNVDLIIKAFLVVLKSKEVQFLVVGVGPKEEDYKKLAEELGISKYIIFTGRVSDEELKKIYSVSNVYVASGEAELQGIAVMEAMACGLPVLGLNAVAIPELVEDGVSGYIFEKNIKDLANKIIKILEDKERLKKMRQASLKIIKEHDFNKTIEKFENLYKKAIDKYNQNN